MILQMYLSVMAKEKTNVEVSVETWRRLQFRKDPGDSFDDVISDLLDEVEMMDE